MNAPLRLNAPCRQRRGVVLIIVLAFVVLLTGLVVAFFSRAMNSRQVSDSSANETKADLLARSAMDIIVGDLKQEIIAGSTVSSGSNNAAWTSSWPNVYTPVSNLTAVPLRSGVPTGAATPIPNLVRRSVRPGNTGGPCPYVAYPVTYGTSAPPNRAADDTNTPANVSTATPSLNGRFISPIRWNSHYLIPCLSATDSTPVGSFVPPDWVIVTRGGANAVTWNANLTETTGSNANYAVGRYAYAIYNEGGLLDVNVAGFPSGLTPAQIGQKGSLALADLTALPISGTAQAYLDQGWVDDLVGWRNIATAQPGGYFNNKPYAFTFNAASASRWLSGFVTSNTTGFLTVSSSTSGTQSDQAFLSRQQLISLCNSLGIDRSALQYLGTFSRELNAPSWGPTKDALTMGAPGNGPGNIYAYKANADSTTAVNRNLPNVRFPVPTTIFRYRDDGSKYSITVNAGDSLLQRRFSLARLNWLGPSGPQNGGNDENIQACFGLRWLPSNQAGLNSAHVWQYVGPTGSTEQSSIETLDQVANESKEREPNFFELLQAGILAGSLGVGGDNSPASLHQLSVPLQILRIGASIINQYSSDCYPRIIEYSQSGAAWGAVGVANLPYIYSFKSLEGASPDDPPNAAAYFVFGLWNPHQTSATPINRPAVRLHVQGSFGIFSNWGKFAKTETFPAGYTAKPYNYYGNPINAFGYASAVPGTTGTTMVLSSATGCGVNGFASAGLIGPSDIGASPADPGPNGLGWALTPSPATASGSGLPGQYVAYRAPDFLVASSATNTIATPPTSWSDGSNAPWSNLVVRFTTSAVNPFQYYLEYQDPSGNWVPYSYATGLNDSATWSGLSVATGYYDCPTTPNPPGVATFPSLWATFQTHSMLMTSDPRSLRFNTWVFQRNDAAPLSLTGPMWDPTASASLKTDWRDAGYGGGAPPPFNTLGNPPAGYPWDVINYPITRFGIYYHPARLSRNNTANTDGSVATWLNTSYVDNDNLRRMGDSGLYTGTDSAGIQTGNPFQRATDRPIILNRPFQSVAELGYAFRDDPWRTLDMFSGYSADAALLDMFSVRDDPVGMEEGHIDLNSQNASALAALLKGTTADAIAGTALAGGSSGTISQLAQDIVKITGTNPLINVSDLVTNVIGSGTATGLTAGDFADPDEQCIKSRREAIARALADAGQTRTWNLLIDLVTQAGAYPPAATALNQFVVKGERRYWLHVAIDRVTGQVIDQKLEQVSE